MGGPKPTAIRRLHDMWVNDEIDGMYTSATLGDFQDDLAEAARRLGFFRRHSGS